MDAGRRLPNVRSPLEELIESLGGLGAEQHGNQQDQRAAVVELISLPQSTEELQITKTHSPALGPSIVKRPIDSPLPRDSESHAVSQTSDPREVAPEAMRKSEEGEGGAHQAAGREADQEAAFWEGLLSAKESVVASRAPDRAPGPVNTAELQPEAKNQHSRLDGGRRKGPDPVQTLTLSPPQKASGGYLQKASFPVRMLCPQQKDAL